MLLKGAKAAKSGKLVASGKGLKSATMKLTTVPETILRPHRKFMKGVPSKRLALSQHRLIAAKKEDSCMNVDICDNSNDSGLGFDHHTDYKYTKHPAYSYDQEQSYWAEDTYNKVKKKKYDVKLESDDATDNFTFPISSLNNSGITPVNVVRPVKLSSLRGNSGPVTLTSQLSATSRDGSVSLQILSQPEQQHRARYQTEGSRGAVKDRTGNGFPVVKLSGYNKPTTLQVFIGTDQGRVMPHMFYQACRVQGKNSTPCIEKKVDGTILIELDVDPANNMNVTCDCVGILKERNVDVEHRFPGESPTRSKKKSTRCRMVFRTSILHPDGTSEVLQVASQPIACTQLPGVPEICKKSLTACPATGGLELFILGKNFLKDTKVVFQQTEGDTTVWEQSVVPDKEFLQQSHLVCMVPPYKVTDILEPVSVFLSVVSSGRVSEPHSFLYTPDGSSSQSPVPEPESKPSSSSLMNLGEMSSSKYRSDDLLTLSSQPSLAPELPVAGYITPRNSPSDVHPVMMWQSPDSGLGDSHQKRQLRGKTMLLPPPALIPLGGRRNSVPMIVPDVLSPPNLKTELETPPQIISPEPKPIVGVQELSPAVPPVPSLSQSQPTCLPLLSTTEAPNMTTLNTLVSEQASAPLPTQSAQSVEKYLSRLENSPPGVNGHPFQQPKASSNFMNYQMPPTAVDNSSFTSSNTHVSNADCKSTVQFSSTNVPITSTNVLQQVFTDSNRSGVIVHPMLMPPETIPSAVLNVPTTVIESQMKTPLIPEASPVAMDTSVSVNSTVTASATENLDAFVNSTAECHIGAGNALCNTQPMESSVLPGPSPTTTMSMSLLNTPVGTAAASTMVASLQSTTLYPPVVEKKPEVEIPQDLKNMSDNDLLKFINPSCFDQGL